jgi:alanyl-tRNA synthetase
MAYRVIADHIRTLTFAISDGGFPSNEGRGYVLRRILRRAVRYAHEKLNAPAGFFAQLTDVVVERFGDAFPELTKNPEAVKEILVEEESQFRKTLERGIQQFGKFARSARNGMISGADAWRLYDTYGFPIDLTRLMADEQGLKIDEEGYLQAQNAAKELSRAGRSGEQDALSKVVIDVHMLAEMERNLAIPKTNDAGKYECAVVEGAVLAIVQSGSLRESISTSNYSDKCGIVLDQTNFYAESGGQMYDCGSLTIDGQCEFAVEAVQAFGGYILHIGHLKYGEVHLGDRVMATFDETRRRPLRQNHTATHLLNFALKKVMCGNSNNGDIQDIEQRGSLVAPDKLRFDFNNKEPLSVEQLTRVEKLVNERIHQNLPVTTRVVPLALAKGINGLRAVFGEVYPDPVRVVAVGADLADVEKHPDSGKWAEASVELCGGTHVRRTGDIREFVILSETAVAKGVRRIVAVTGEAAAEAARVEQDLFSRLKSSLDDTSIRAITKDIEAASCSAIKKAELMKQLEEVRHAALQAEKAAQADLAKRVIASLPESSDKFVVARVEAGSNVKAITAGLQELLTRGKAGLLYSVDPATGRIYYQSLTVSGSSASAVEWAKAFESVLEGARSGGKAASAQGTAPIPANSLLVEEAQSLAVNFASMKL